MSRSSAPSVPSEARKIDVSLSDDMRFWTRNLGVSEINLREAITKVGSMSNDVRAELRRKRIANDSPRVVRVFVFYPSANHPDFWVLLPGTEQHTFPTEGAAVAFALQEAKSLRRSGRAVEVIQEKITGTWMRMND